MSNFDIELPNLNVDVSDSVNKTLVVLRQPSGVVVRSSTPMVSVAESAVTASYALTSSVTLSTVSASYALTASYVSGATATWNTVTNKPSGLVSGAAQITSLGFISQSTTPTGTVSSSAQITALGFISQSTIPAGTISSSAQLPVGTLSSSAQISESGFVSSSTINTIQTITSASYAAITPVSGTLYIIID